MYVYVAQVTSFPEPRNTITPNKKRKERGSSKDQKENKKGEDMSADILAYSIEDSIEDRPNQKKFRIKRKIHESNSDYEEMPAKKRKKIKRNLNLPYCRTSGHIFASGYPFLFQKERKPKEIWFGCLGIFA